MRTSPVVPEVRLKPDTTKTDVESGFSRTPTAHCASGCRDRVDLVTSLHKRRRLGQLRVRRDVVLDPELRLVLLYERLDFLSRRG